MNIKQLFPPARRTWLLLGLCAGLLTGCVNLKGIRQFADSAADTASYTALTSYYVDGPEHMKRYEETKAQQEALDKESAARQNQETALLGLHRGIQSYMKAVGALASDEVVSYDQSLKKLGDQLKETKVISDSKVDAFQSIAGILARAATDGYRQRKLKQLIGEANDPFQKVAAGLKELAGDAYVRSLNIELEVLNTYYRDVVRSAQANDPATELVKETWRTKREELEARRKACLVYAETIDRIAKGHQELFDNRNKLNAKVVLDTIATYSHDLEELRNRIKELTK